MGAIRIIVPPDLTVRIDGIGFMGEFKRAADGSRRPRLHTSV
ncbi:hypothetical protein [Kutzneria sp. 744]|nr:hypothetical protein [Kutzneria sp. 744]